jgi:hypothetical protein
MLGLNISAGLDSIVNIYIVIPLILIPQLLLSGVTVKFDDLHKSLTSKVYVPLIGDLMFSRWAYEALAVEQAKNNRYDRNFYVYDQRISEATFTRSFLVTDLLNKLEICNRNMGPDGDPDILVSNLELIYNEIEKLGEHPDIFEFEYLSSLNINDFSEEVFDETVGWLNYYIRGLFLDIRNEAIGQKDSVQTSLEDSLGTEGIYKLRQDYQNGRLYEIVTSRDELNKILEIKSRLVQKEDPIYMIPESNIGRAHFYAPYKRFNDQLYDTKWYNLGVLWGFSFLLYITLLLDMLRKLMVYFNGLMFRRENK